MTQQDIEVAERLQAKAWERDGIKRETKEEWAKKYNAANRSVFSKAGNSAVAVTAVASTSANSSEDLEAVRSTFGRFDADGSGSLDKNELEKVLKAISIKPSSIDKIFTLMDGDGNGEIYINEFMLWMNGDSNAKVIASDAVAEMDKIDTDQIPPQRIAQKPVDSLDILMSPKKTARKSLASDALMSTGKRSSQLDTRSSPEKRSSVLDTFISPEKRSSQGVDSLDILMSPEKSAQKSSDALEESNQGGKVTVKVRRHVKVNPSPVKVKPRVDAGSPSQTPASDATGRAAIEQLFRKWDVDGSGQLGREEFHSACRATGMKPTHIDMMLDLADVDKSGTINVNEFIDWAFKKGIPGG